MPQAAICVQQSLQLQRLKEQRLQVIKLFLKSTDGDKDYSMIT